VVIIIKLIIYISLLPLLCAWYLIKVVFVLGYYMIKLMISAILQIFQIVFNNIRGNKVYYNYSESSPKKEKISKKKEPRKSYKEEQFDKEAELWGLSEEDKRIAKEERMSPADFIEAEERDDDELITDEWEEDKYK
jgi:hypothetical protein